MSKLSVTEIDRLIGKRIQQKRKELRLSASELSEQIGIAQQQLSRYERGENKINVAHLVEIASKLAGSLLIAYQIKQLTINENSFLFQKIALEIDLIHT